MRRLDLTNERFGRLVAIKLTNTGVCTKWECICDCGNKTIVRTDLLRSGRTQSCGCYFKEVISNISTTHGLSTTAEYFIWASMIQRCNNPNSHKYPMYGGRGIKVCDRWLSFNNFISDMGLRPSNLYSIDRYPDNNGNYGPDNCRWATTNQQHDNRNLTIWITYKAQTRTLSNWANLFGLEYQELYNLLKTYKLL